MILKCSSAAGTLASSTGTPWAAYDADFYAAQAANVTAVSNAAKANAIAQATAQKTAEVAQTNAETTWRNAYATASSVLNTGIAGAHLGFATAQSLIYSAMGGSNLQLPTVSRPTDLAGEYKVPGPSNTYRTSISSVTSTNYYYGWWGGYWWGAWGYYGSGYWYSGYGGYYGYLYGSQVSSAASVTLQEPQKQFPGSFWQIDSDQIADQMRDGAIEVRYGDTKVSELVMPVDVPVGSLQSINIPVRSSDDAVTSEEVAAILKSKDDELADFVSDKASITTLPVRERPVVYVAAHYQSTDDSPQAPTKEKQGSADDRFYITVPAQWNAETVAAAVQQAARGEETPLQNGAQIRSLFLKHIDSRTPGFEVRQTGRFAGSSVYYNSADAVVTLESGVYWRSYKQETFFGGQVGITAIDTKIGVLASNGWVRLLSGERATLSALQKWSRSFRGASNDQINTTLDALISPFHVDTSATQLGIFIGGTGMHFLGLGNVERLYNVYEGSKFYYGGIGNPVDYDSPKDFYFDGGFGLGWSAILDRAVADIQRFLQPGQEIHIFGFSRGAAMANELAKRLADLGMRVAFVGMYDPVYSVGRAGQNSRYVDSTYAGAAGNYVNGTISGNVDAAAVLYAINEDRSFFPATQFTPQGSTKLLTMMSPGAHSDIGGHFENNLLIQQMNLRAMIEFARGYGRAKFSFRGIEDDVARIISSPVSKAIALVDAENPAKSGQRWNDASVFEQWRPLTTDQYIAELKAIGSLGWASNWESEGGYGTQKGWLLGGVEAVVSRLFIDPPIRRFWDPPSPWSSHIARSFDWQNRELWDLSMSDSSGKKLVLTDLQKAQFRMLYLRKIDPYEGGWKK